MSPTYPVSPPKALLNKPPPIDGNPGKEFVKKEPLFSPKITKTFWLSACLYRICTQVNTCVFVICDNSALLVNAVFLVGHVGSYIIVTVLYINMIASNTNFSKSTKLVLKHVCTVFLSLWTSWVAVIWQHIFPSKFRYCS